MSVEAVRVWEERVEIPTYPVGAPSPYPMFLEKRVYQGSSGRVYPYPVIDKIFDEPQPCAYQLVCLENDYLYIALLPQLGGRVYRALDKTNGYDFVYYNRVIKPALVGLAGPWISGGIEFNWPQHHRPNTFGPVEYGILAPQGDGSGTVWLSEIDRMEGTKMLSAFTLSPGKAYLAITTHLYNRTTEPQTFLWWANPAVSVNDQTQSIFPPDVHAVFDHGKRDVSSFPIATGMYYKMDYSAGVDISRYANIPVPTSYMVAHSDFDFFGQYDHGRQAGMLHIANHAIAPGKKQWTWGCGDFGQAWDRQLTDEDGPYHELMAGVYTDNQPDFSWLQPFETKSFTQYFLPYKAIGAVKNATIDAAINLELDQASQTALVQAYATAEYTDATVTLTDQAHTYLEEHCALSPTYPYVATVAVAPGVAAHELRLTVRDAQGAVLVTYQPASPKSVTLPDPALPLPSPAEMVSTEALYLAGMHLEQYRHATFAPEPYYREGLRRDPYDSRLNLALGRLLLRRGALAESESHVRQAIITVTRHNGNPYEGEAYYQLGIVLKWQQRHAEAVDALYKATWSAAWQESSYFVLARIACGQQRYQEALELVEQSLAHNTRHVLAHHLKAILLRQQQAMQAAEACLDDLLKLDPACFGAYYERYALARIAGRSAVATAARQQFLQVTRADVHNILAVASEYMACGLSVEAAEIVQLALPDSQQPRSPLLAYYLGYLLRQLGQVKEAEQYEQIGAKANPDGCFPNTLTDLIVLQSVVAAQPGDSRARYYLGNWFYDKQRYEDAITQWEASRALDATLPGVHRNLALAYFNKRGDQDRALAALEAACACDPTDARLIYERDQLYKRCAVPPAQRLALLEDYQEAMLTRDDLTVEYITLLNTLERYEAALALLTQRRFHPWEGGEGKVTGQYMVALIELAKKALDQADYHEALTLLTRAMHYPENLGEGKLAGAAENQLNYYLSLAYSGLGFMGLGFPEQAADVLKKAGQGSGVPGSQVFYNDQPPEQIFYQGLALRAAGMEHEASACFQQLIKYGHDHLQDVVRIDYFAVSLPDFLIFEDDLTARNMMHCHFLLGLGHLGLDETELARGHFAEVLQRDPAHQGAILHMRMLALAPGKHTIQAEEA